MLRSPRGFVRPADEPDRRQPRDLKFHATASYLDQVNTGWAALARRALRNGGSAPARRARQSLPPVSPRDCGATVTFLFGTNRDISNRAVQRFNAGADHARCGATHRADQIHANTGSPAPDKPIGLAPELADIKPLTPTLQDGSHFQVTHK